MTFKGILELIIDRPLVFLCGCAVDEKNIRDDRREILKKAIAREWRNDKIKSIPLIVDYFFKQELIEKYSLKVNLLEEIVANVSYCTYIFLDTMSTSYELGQFTNYSYSHNKVRVLVDNEYEIRNNCYIGGYISLSFDGKFIKYDAKYNPRGHISFRKRALPPKLKELIKNDNPVNNQYIESIPLSFTNKNIELTNGLFKYKRFDYSLVFTCNLFTLFYFVTGVYHMHHKELFKNGVDSITIDSLAFKKFKNTVIEEVFRSYLYMANPDERKIIFDNSVKPSLFIENFNEEELIYHCLSSSFLLPLSGSRFKNLLGREYQRISFGESSLEPLRDYISSYEYIIEKNKKYEYQKLPTITKECTIRGKRRLITTYTNDYYGKNLRLLHNRILSDVLSILPSSTSSFAYKTKLNCLKCVKEHFGNTYFIKIDISKYFDSIKYTNLVRMITGFVDNKISTIINYNFSTQRVYDDVRKLIKPLFINYKTPIGFICSPKISDFYLYNIDERMKSLNNVTYTRYADDILISSKSKENLNKAFRLIEKELKELNLSINQEKCLVKELKNDNDSIKFLNINIIRRRNEHYEVSISRKYLEKTVNLIIKDRLSREDRHKSIIGGRANYIKSISLKSYSIFLRMIKVKTGLDKYRFESIYEMRRDVYIRFIDDNK